MLKPIIKFVFFIILVVLATNSALLAQDSTKEKSYFKASISYLTNSVYNGRKDSLLYPYITPTLGYYDKSGFYVNGSLSYLRSSSEKRIDLFTLGVGYDFDISTNLSGGIYADKYFYNNSSTNIQSDIKGNVGGSLSYDFGLLQLSAGADVLFASKSDFAVNGGIAHAFYIGDESNNRWSITPTATAHMSTLNFYEGYTNRRAGKTAQNGNPNAGTVTSVTSITNRGGTELTLLDYELSLPITYDAKGWGFAITPTLALPQNPIYTSTTTTFKPAFGTGTTTQTSNSTPQSEKSFGTPFYAEVSLYFKF
ncbi:MAG: hypothetical protein H7068_08870 [Pedobacter sp.]|nr:hypothetical protein [Chitinophagaceae bacterium]